MWPIAGPAVEQNVVVSVGVFPEQVAIVFRVVLRGRGVCAGELGHGVERPPDRDEQEVGHVTFVAAAEGQVDETVDGPVVGGCTLDQKALDGLPSSVRFLALRLTDNPLAPPLSDS